VNSNRLRLLLQREGYLTINGTALITVCVSGVGGLALFLEALYRLFQEGKISRALYEQVLKIVTKQSL